uniref:Endoplasmic reticulum resident protein 44 n=1 Tax=Cacopsylla melanoneura TaxID=428564 RepID=A0A8D8RQJ3_9HEMI
MFSLCRQTAFSPLLLLVSCFIVFVLDACSANINDVIPTLTAPEVATPPTPAAAAVVNNSIVIELTHDNVDHVRETYDFVLILFYVRWCRFSVAVLPTFDEVVIQLAKLLPEPRKYAITKIDCDEHEDVCESYSILKYPTIKVVRYGSIEKMEYRKERTVEAFVTYVKEELMDPTIEAYDEQGALQVEPKARKVIGHFTKDRHEEVDTFRKASTHFRSLCKFILVFKEALEPNKARIYFHPDPNSPETEADEMKFGETFTFPELRDWANYKCVPYVREITFENAEELTEEGLPLFILFYNPKEHTDLVKAFRHLISTHFVDHIINRKINFVTANGLIFEHPLQHMEKSDQDLPVIAIDSLKHLFSYPFKERENLLNLEKLHRFLDDYFSERLHLKFHGLVLNEEDAEKEADDDTAENVAPHPTREELIPLPSEVTGGNDDGHGQGAEDDGQGAENGEEEVVREKVRDSTFVRLYPSELRYTLKQRIRDEL